jgi:hypothetical protein
MARGFVRKEVGSYPSLGDTRRRRVAAPQASRRAAGESPRRSTAAAAVARKCDRRHSSRTLAAASNAQAKTDRMSVFCVYLAGRMPVFCVQLVGLAERCLGGGKAGDWEAER